MGNTVRTTVQIATNLGVYKPTGRDNEREGERHRRKKTIDNNPYSLFVLQVIKATDTFSLGRREQLGCSRRRRVHESGVGLNNTEADNTNRSTSIATRESEE
jgi:hypothetical protein